MPTVENKLTRLRNKDRNIVLGGGPEIADAQLAPGQIRDRLFFCATTDVAACFL